MAVEEHRKKAGLGPLAESTELRTHLQTIAELNNCAPFAGVVDDKSLYHSLTRLIAAIEWIMIGF
jgi:hypothetical protein